MKISHAIGNALYGPAVLAALAISSVTAETETLQPERKHLRELKLKDKGTKPKPGAGTGIDKFKNKFNVIADDVHPTKKIKDPDVNEPNIVNGEEVDPRRKYKFFVSIGGCGASLVAPNVILSAAHCADTINGPAVLGLHMKRADGAEEFENIEIIDFKDHVTHPQYSANTIDNDYWVIQLKHDSQLYKDYVVDLDTSGGSPSVLTSGRDLTVIGMGATASGGSTPNVLQEITVDYIPNSDCCTGSYGYECNELTANMMCATRPGQDSCQGDSGGPIFDTITQKQVGIVSWGYGCADPEFPGVYARISARYGWIKAQIDTFSSGGMNPPPPKFSGVCYNFPGSWWDRDGVQFGCDWYANANANENNCDKYGSGWANGGLTANEVCCVCGGGEIFDGNSPSKAPTPPTPPPSPATTTRSPSKAPSLATTDRMLYCGIPGKCSGLGGDQAVPMDEPNKVRCCTTDQNVGWPQKCNTIQGVYGESNVPGCYSSKTFEEAVAICGAYPGGRLCSGAEMADRCTRGTGCQFNKQLVWGCSPTNLSCQADAECCDGICSAGRCAYPYNF